MPAERFYIDAELKGELTLEGNELHHLVHVMRIKVGEEVELVNGKGGFAKAKVETVAKGHATLLILSSQTTPLPTPHLVLAVPLMRPAKLELVIEKCTELGTDAFWLYEAEHSEKGALSEHQWERLRHVAISAMKQCGRLWLPPIEQIEFEAIFQANKTVLFGDPRRKEFSPIPKGEILFVSGPEKGFSKEEQQGLEEKGVAVLLSRHILRAETAPMAASAILQVPK